MRLEQSDAGKKWAAKVVVHERNPSLHALRQKCEEKSWYIVSLYFVQKRAMEMLKLNRCIFYEKEF